MDTVVHSSSFAFNVSSGMLVLLSVFFIAACCLAHVAYRRNPRRLTMGLEILKLVVIVGLLVLLMQPEWVSRSSNTGKASMIVLWDESGSMATQDVEREGKGALIGRDDLVRQIIESKFWAPLEGETLVETVGFSAPEKTPDGNASPLSGTDIEGALNNTFDEVDNLKAVILLSDGDQTKEGTPLAAAQRYRKRGVPIYTVPIGSEKSLPDISIESVRAPAYGVVGESVHIPVLIKSSMGYEIDTTLTLTSRTGETRTKDIRLPAYGELEQSILWQVLNEGEDNLELSVPVATHERADKNNRREFTMTGRRELIRVLIIESEPRWEYRFIRNALNRDPGVQVDVLLFHPLLGERASGEGYLSAFPENMEDIAKYDVVFIGDVGMDEKNGLTPHQAELLKGLVESQASGIVFLPGSRGNQASLMEGPLGELMPIIYEKDKKEGYLSSTPSPLILTQDGRSSLLTFLTDSEADNAELWRRFPGFYWSAPVERAKAGTQTLATHSTQRNRYGRLPLLVAKVAGAGKVLFMGTDSAWRWRRGVEDKYHYRFWGQVARWMSYQRNMAVGDRLRVYPNPERPKFGDSVLLTATAAQETGAPLTKGHVSAELIAPDGKTTLVRELEEQSESWGVYTGSFKLNQPGEWKVKVLCEELPGIEAELSLLTQGEEVEKVGRFARPDIMKEIAQLTNGRMISPDRLDALIPDLKLLPEPQPSEVRYFLWSHWLAGALLILLLGLYWGGRKINGTF